MGIGEIIFYIVLLGVIERIIDRIFNIVDYKVKNKKEIPSNTLDYNKDVSFEEFDSILDEDDLKDLSDEEVVSFNEIEIGEENENK